jgi:SAM-dependent methyltransferase
LSYWCSDSQLMCPCCGSCIESWDAIGGFHGQGRRRAVCPVCHSRERHRALCYGLLTDPPVQLHAPSASVAFFGPERSVVLALKKARPRLCLLELDFFAKGYNNGRYSATTLFADVQNLTLLADGVLDGAIILHVLEHVPSLARAAGELARVVRPGGFLEHETPCATAAARDVYCADARARQRAHNASLPRECVQFDHLWSFSCTELRAAFATRGFACHDAPRGTTSRTATRFGLGTALDLGRFRCVRDGSASSCASSTESSSQREQKRSAKSACGALGP